MMNRRRFLMVTAGAALLPATGHAQTWQGRGFGADISMTIHAERNVAKAAIAQARKTIREMEQLFSLYDPTSALSRLNANGVLLNPGPHMRALFQAADRAHQITDGLFDPSIGRLWAVIASGRKPYEYEDTVGWDRVQFEAGAITLDDRQAMTFNGIAQGYATDKVTEVLASYGLDNVLVNIGEHRGIGGPWQLALHDPAHGTLGNRTLTTGAIATSSAAATPLGRDGHIIHHTARVRWSTVSVEAPNATMADALSTALVLAPLEQVKAIKARSDITRITLVDAQGDLITL